MKVLIQNFNLSNFKFQIGKQEIKHMSIDQLKDFLTKIPYDTSGNTISIRIVTYQLIIKKLDKETIRYEWNNFYTYRYTKNKKCKIINLDEIFYNSKKCNINKLIDAIIIVLFSSVWILLGLFNLQSIQNFLFIEAGINVINLFFLWLLVFTSVGFLNYFIKNIFIIFIKFIKFFRIIIFIWNIRNTIIFF